MTFFPGQPSCATFVKLSVFQACWQFCICCQVSCEPVSNLTRVSCRHQRAGDEYRFTAFALSVSQILDVRKVSTKSDGIEWWGLCLHPSQPTWASLPLREMVFSSLSQASLFIGQVSQGVCEPKMTEAGLLHKTPASNKIKCSLFICCSPSRQASLVCRYFSTLCSQPWLYLHHILRTPQWSFLLCFLLSPCILL